MITKYEVKPSSRFRKDLKLMQKQKKDIVLLNSVVKLLADGMILPPQYKDHDLEGQWKGHRECHIQPDWLLIYRFDDDILVLTLTRTGSHSDLF